MTAGDAMGTCRHRGEVGHLPHPDGRPCIVNADQAEPLRPAPGVYREDQGRCPHVFAPEVIRCVQAADRCPGHAEPSYTGPTWDELLRAHDETMQDRLARLRHVRHQLDQARAEVAEVREAHQRCCELVAQLHAAGTGRTGEGPHRGVVEDVEDERTKLQAECERLRKGWDQAYQQGWRQGQEQRLTWRRERDQAREQTAELMREVAQLHRALDSLGTNPDTLAREVGAGQAVTLYGRVYVARELLDLGAPGPVAGKTWAGAEELADLRDCTAPEPPLAERVREWHDSVTLHAEASELLEAEGGVFVPVPAGHMLSVTVTPYDSMPAEEEDTPRPATAGLQDMLRQAEALRHPFHDRTYPGRWGG